MSVLTVQSLSAWYGHTQVLHDISLRCETGRTTAIMGVSGVGKTTLTHSLLGLLAHRGGRASGSMTTDTLTLDLAKPTAAAWTDFRGNDLSLMVQDARASLDPRRVVADQLKLASLDPHHCDTHQLLRRAGFDSPDEVIDKYPHELSGGMARRVTFAQALARNSLFLLADEPTSGLDPVRADTVLNALKQSVKERIGLIIISHDLRAVRQIADDIIIMSDGRFVEHVSVTDAQMPIFKSTAGRAFQESTDTLNGPKLV